MATVYQQELAQEILNDLRELEHEARSDQLHCERLVASSPPPLAAEYAVRAAQHHAEYVAYQRARHVVRERVRP